MRTLLHRLYQLFSHEDRLLILMDADPDAIASGLALKRLFWHRLTNCTLCHIRPVTRPQNQRMIRLLGINTIPLADLNPADFNRTAIIDSQPGHNPLFGGMRYDLIIDHHPRLPDSQAQMVDIRPEYGATATMITEYLRAARIKPSLKLATALYYGIKTDTANFERPAIEADVRAFHYLFRFTRPALVRKLEFAELSVPQLRYFRLALRRLRLRHQRLYSFLGRVPTPDILVILADFFLRLEEVAWSVIGGVYEDRLVVIFRNDGLRKNAGRLAQRAFARLGSAGGHTASARAEVPLGHLDKALPQGQCTWEDWQNFIIRRVEAGATPRSAFQAPKKE